MLSKVFITITAFLLALLSVVPASAKIFSISSITHVPPPGGPFSPIFPNSHIYVHFTTTPGLPKYKEYYIVFELKPASGPPTLVGNGYDLVAAGLAKTPPPGTFKVKLHLPSSLTSGLYTLRAVVFHTVRANLWFIEGTVD
jgi:hypothetical protein